MPGQALPVGISDVGNGIYSPCIFRVGSIIEVKSAVITVIDDILQNRPETASCFVNIRLSFRVQSNYLSITAAFKIKDACIAPTMLVIADQATFRIITEGSFACAA